MAISNVSSGTVTAAGAVSGNLDISGMAGDLTLVVTILELKSASGTPRVRVILEDSVDAFTGAKPVLEWNVEGPVVAGTPLSKAWRRYEIPSIRGGTASAVLRVNVVEISGGTPSCTVMAQAIN
jgi:hypothetical protein